MQKALESIRFWRGTMIKAFFDVDIHDPRKIEENGQVIGDDTLNVTSNIKCRRRYKEASELYRIRVYRNCFN